MKRINIDEHVKHARCGSIKSNVTKKDFELENMLLRVRLEQLEAERVEHEQKERARVNAERLLTEKMRARRESLDLQEKQRQIDEAMKKLQDEEEIKQKIQSNLNKIKEIKKNVREQSKNSRLEALSKGYTPNLNSRQIPKKKQPSMSKSLSQKLTKAHLDKPDVSKPKL